MSEPGDVIERMARAIWLLETQEGWDDGSGIEKRMNIHTGLLCTAADYEEIARACHPIAFNAALERAAEIAERTGMNITYVGHTAVDGGAVATQCIASGILAARVSHE